MTFKLGMCGFTIGAKTYYRKFPVVEVQQTFYDPPPFSTVEKWRREAPPDFEFTMKAWQVITHLGTSRTYRRLRREFSERERSEAGAFHVNATTLSAWNTTLECARILRATAILFQCPPSFKATEENVAAMHEFFGTIDRPQGVNFMWEPRGPWPDEVVLKVCRDLNLVHAVDPFVRPSLTPELLYWRLHGNRSHYANYSDEELRQIISWFPDDPRIPCYVLFNNIPRVADVRRFVDLVGELDPPHTSDTTRRSKL